MRIAIICFATAALLSANAFAALTTFYVNDFESGLQDVVDIAPGDDGRYETSETTVVSSDTDYPGAFPPPSGSNVLRAADDNNNLFGLSSGHSSYYVDTTAVNQFSIQADIYVAPTTAANDDFNALIAVHDTDAPDAPGIESYWRLGFRNQDSEGLVLQTFNGASFAVVGTDTAIGNSLASPEWHEFRMDFDFSIASPEVNCFVNGAPASFNPVLVSNLPLPYLTVGVLGFDFPEQEPILADDFEMASDPASVPVELSTFTTD